MQKMGDIIRKLRIQKNMTQEELGKVIGVQKSAIRKYESGLVQNIKRSSIKKLADFFEVSPSFLLGYEDNTSPQSDFTITHHERTVIQAYRDQPAMQPAVDRILGVEEDLAIDLAEDMAEALTEGDQMAQVLSTKKSIPSSK